MEDNNTTEYSVRRRHRNEEEPRPGKLRKLRQVLNIIFIIGAIVGVATYYWHDHDLGLYIVLGSMIFKFIEVSIRLLPK